MVQSCLESGVAYSYISRGEDGIPTAITYLKPEWVTAIPITDIFKEQNYTISAPGLHVTVPACQLIIVRYYFDGEVTRSPLDMCSSALDTALACNQSAEEYFSSGQNPRFGFLSTDKPLSPNAKAEIQSTWQQSCAMGNGNGIPVLSNGLSYSAISKSPLESQMLESRRFSTEEVCRIFGLQPSDLGEHASGGSSFASIEQNSINFLCRVLQPFIEQFENELTNKMFLGRDRKYAQVRFDTSALLRADKQAQANYLSKMVSCSGLTPNEVRKAIDMPTIGEEGDIPMIQSNYLALKNAIKATQGSNVSVKEDENKNNEDNQ